MKMSTISCHSF